MYKYLLSIFLLSVGLITAASSMAATPKAFAFKRYFDPVEAFEKVYVTPHALLCTPTGIYLKHSNGTLEKMRAVMHDNKGMYALRVIMQCPMCGRCYTHKEGVEGFCCPLYERELVPGIWGTP
jgi:hypothetical protein